MLKGKYRKQILNSSIPFKVITILGLSIVVLASLSLFNQINRLDVIEFGKSEQVILLDIQSLKTNMISNSSLLEKSKIFTNTGIIKLEESVNSTKRKASLFSVIYANIPVLNENFGTMTIFKLDRVLPILQGINEKQLRQGVGHVESSVLPGENDNLVLAGHRETSFRKLDKLIIGDLILIETELGEFTYEVDNTRIVEDDDTTVIISTGYASLTLITCYPFDYIGSAPQRFIVTATLIQSSVN